jgi:hypothetical protein
MLKRTVVSTFAVAIALATAVAQNPEPAKSTEPAKFYRLDFVVKEVEGGKVLNARAYSMMTAGDARDIASMRTGTKVPVAIGTGASFQYIDVGVNIDCRSIKEVQRDLSLYVSAEISSLPSEPAQPITAATTGMAPAVRQNRWSSWVIVPLKRSTPIFSSDDPASKRQMQVDLTVTPIGQ